MKKFDIYISFIYSVRVREFEKVDDFTLSRSDYYHRSLVIQDLGDRSVYEYFDSYDFEDYSSFTKRLRNDLNEIALKSLEFAGISRSSTLDNLTFSDCHKIDLVLSKFEQIESDFLMFEPGHYFHTTGYFDDSVNPGCVEVNLYIIEKES